MKPSTEKPPTEQQSRIIWAAATGLSVGVIIALIVGAVWGLGQVLQLFSPVLWPLAVAGVLAYLLDPVVDFFQRRGMPRARAILCVFGVAAIIVLGLFASFVPSLVRETRDLIAKVPSYSQRLQERVEGWINNPPALLQKYLKPPPPVPAPAAVSTNETLVTTNEVVLTLDTNAPVVVQPADPGDSALFAGGVDRQTLKSATSWFTQMLPRIGNWVVDQFTRVASWLGVLVGLALLPIYTFYLLLEKRSIESQWTNYLPLSQSSLKDELIFVIRSINNYLIAFFRGQVLVAICDGILYTIGFLIIGLPYAIVIGAMATVLTMIPFLGAIVTCITALIIALVQFGDWQHPLMVLGVFGVVQTLEGLVIAPKVMGDRVGLHPLTIIIAVMAGTTLLGGLLGGILAIPLTAALKVILSRYIWKRRGN
jgi:predicted PurR-regulated permease PerM